MGTEEGKSLAETPTWAVATVISLMVAVGFVIHGGLKKFGKWLDRTKRKQLLAALEKIREELMVFGLLSLLMGHWIVFVAKICVKSSAMSSRFYPCAATNYAKRQTLENYDVQNSSISRSLLEDVHQDFCPKGHEPFASYESLEQLHRFLFVLGVTHVSYSFLAVALAMIKIYSWRRWENHAKTMALRGLLTVDSEDAGRNGAQIRRLSSLLYPHSLDSEGDGRNGVQIRRLSSFIFHRTSHPWSQHGFLVWLLCFSRQFWSSINQADYSALRLGFITTHQLPFTYDFHNYMLRSMEEEFRDIVGISLLISSEVGVRLRTSHPRQTLLKCRIYWIGAILSSDGIFYVLMIPWERAILRWNLLVTLRSLPSWGLFMCIPLWIFAMTCIVLGFHGTNVYFWVSFLPTVLILLVGTKLHRIVVKLAVDVRDTSQWVGFQQFNLRDELFWFGNPRFLLRLIQFVSFQNAFEMAMYIWSMWEIKEPSCFAGDRTTLVIRLSFGVISQFWCSFITFPLYVIVAQMGSKFKKTIVSANVRKSLHGWRRKVTTRRGGAPFTRLGVSPSVEGDGEKDLENTEERSTLSEGSIRDISRLRSQQNERSSSAEATTN